MGEIENFLERISSYNILTNFIPGAVFLYLSDRIWGIDFLVENQILNLALIYFVGMILSRIGSICVEPILKNMKIIHYVDHKNFIEAEKKDSKISVLLETNNMYRSFVGMFLLMFVEFVFIELCRRCSCVAKFKFAIFCVILFLLFVVSYRKQTAYIKSRIENKMGEYK
ncbi:MAG: hypothetical protein K2F89_04765 [Treponemataceae bacterium]|nr:hypothetical protein [Treponemataceae bacterium]